MSISVSFSKRTRSAKATLVAIIACLLSMAAISPSLAEGPRKSAKPAITSPGKAFDPLITRSKFTPKLDDSLFSLDIPFGEKRPHILSLRLGHDAKSEEKAPEGSKDGTTLDRFVDSFRYMYTDKSNLLKIGVAFGTAGIMANTNIDQWLQDKYQDDIRGERTDDHSAIFKTFGEGEYLIPSYLLAYGLGHVSDNNTIKEWGERAGMATLIGVPALLAGQRFLGASRPDEGRGSDWRFFADTNGVSGHAFMGAVPFLTAAKMTNNIWARTAFYIASPLCALSRVNDNSHYPSQALLGYALAWLSVNSVDRHVPKIGGCEIVPVVDGEYFGVLLTKSFE